MTEKFKKCQICRNELLCKAWFRELESAEECYAETDHVTIYTRFIVNGEGCEYFQEIAYENPALTIDELKEINADMDNRPWVWIEVFPEYRLFNPRSEAEPAYYRVQADYTEGKAFCCGYPGLGFYFKYEDYGKTWLAYKKTLITSTNH